VTITKKSGMSLQFGVTASDDGICIDSLAMKQPEVSEDQPAYEGPEFK
jgi:complement component 1 Q subcomponent-binding protein